MRVGSDAILVISAVLHDFPTQLCILLKGEHGQKTYSFIFSL